MVHRVDRRSSPPISFQPEHNLNCPAKIKEFWKNRLFVRNNARDGTTVDFIHIPRPRRPSEIVGQKKKQRTSDAALSISPERTASPSVVAEEEYAETDGRGKRRRLDGPASSLRQGKGKGKGMGRAFPLPPHSCESFPISQRYLPLICLARPPAQSSTSTLTSLSPDLSVPVPEPDLPLDLDFPRSLSPPFSRYTSSSPRPTSPSSNDTLQRIPMSSLYGDLASWEDLNLDDLSLRRTEGELVWDFYRVENGYLRFFEAPHAEMEQKAPRIVRHCSSLGLCSPRMLASLTSEPLDSSSRGVSHLFLSATRRSLTLCFTAVLEHSKWGPL